jgi:hypothetical protein
MAHDTLSWRSREVGLNGGRSFTGSERTRRITTERELGGDSYDFSGQQQQMITEAITHFTTGSDVLQQQSANPTTEIASSTVTETISTSPHDG